jgi:hypothetical protein
MHVYSAYIPPRDQVLEFVSVRVQQHVVEPAALAVADEGALSLSLFRD